MILEAKNLEFSYTPEKVLFHDVSLSVNRGEILAILGANGAGKSTLLNCLANLLTPQKGEVLLKGRPVNKISLRETARCVGYVPQSHRPAYGYQVRDFIVMGRAPYLGIFRQPGKEAYMLADQVMDEMGIAHLAHRSYTDLSGGERQQVTIARAMVQQPDLIMLDEPTNHLDYGNQQRMIHTIKRLADRGFGIIITSHMPDHVLLLDGKVGILDDEGNFQVGVCGEMMKEERLRSLYHVDIHLVYEPAVNRVVCVSGEGEK